MTALALAFAARARLWAALMPLAGSLLMTDLPELAIRLRRAAFNRALAEADLATIGPPLAADVVMVTGSDSAVIAGRKAQLATWKREFAAPDRTIYVRTPDALLHHSDQGSQYTSEQFQRLMADNGVTSSMSRSGNVWDSGHHTPHQ